MNDQEAYDYYANPDNRRLEGTPVRRQRPRLTSMSSVRFDPGTLQAVKDRASREGITVGHWIRQLVDREIKRQAGAERPSGLIAGSGRRGPPPLGARRCTFACSHMSVGNVISASCWACGPLEAAS